METTNTTKLYLAYGANVCPTIFAQRCPNARRLGTVELRDYMLVFRGVADLVRQPGATAVAVVWEISATDEEALDKHESLGTRYMKRLIDLDVAGERRTAMMYVMVKRLKEKGQQLPYAAYEACLKQGYAGAGLDVERIEKAKARAQRWCEANEIDPTEDRFFSRVWQPVQGSVVLAAPTQQ